MCMLLLLLYQLIIESLANKWITREQHFFSHLIEKLYLEPNSQKSC